jgi:hypothetical protein
LAIHKYKIGQRVNFTPSKTTLTASNREYKVIRLLPALQGQNQYRIKSIAEDFERMVIEDELAAK